jgi:hypothetical protein
VAVAAGAWLWFLKPRSQGPYADKEVVVFFVQCPLCGAPVELPADAVGTNRSDRWNVTGCIECDSTFDFDNDEVQFDADNDSVSA